MKAWQLSGLNRVNRNIRLYLLECDTRLRSIIERVAHVHWLEFSMFRALRRAVFNTKAFGVDVYALYLAARDPRTPRYARVLGLLVAAYAFSPIDLIPDFIPGLGLLDDLIVIPLGLKLVSGLIPDDVRSETRARAAVSTIARPRFWRWVAVISVIIVLFWLAMLGLLFYLILVWLW